MFNARFVVSIFVLPFLISSCDGVFKQSDGAFAKIFNNLTFQHHNQTAKIGDNILDPKSSQIMSDFYLDEKHSGQPVSFVGWTIFDYSPVNPGVTYASNADVTHSVWYDQSKNFLAPFGNGIAPATASYVRVSIQTPAVPITMLIYGGNLPVAYQPYSGPFESPAPIPTPSAPAVVTGINILNVADARNVNGSYINERYIGTLTELSGWYAFYFAPVVPGLAYNSNLDVTHSAWFDANQVFISAFANGLAPGNAAFVRVSIRAGFESTAMLIQGASVPASYVPYAGGAAASTPTPTATPGATATPTPVPGANPFANGKAVVLGTSLTFQSLYVYYLKSKLGLSTVVNKGISGQLVRTMADQLTAADLQGSLFVSIEGCTNDYGHGFSTAGSASDPASAATLVGDLKTVVAKIRSLSPNIPIFVLNDTWRGAYGSEPVPPAANPYGLTIESATNAMMVGATALGIGHWDAYHLSGINSTNFDTYTEDHLHWNDAGASLIGNGYADYIMAYTSAPQPLPTPQSISSRGYDTSAHLVLLAQKETLQSALDQYSNIRLENGDYSQGAGALSLIKVSSNQKIYGLRDTSVPPIQINAGTQFSVLSNISAPSLTFLNGPPIQNNLFVQVHTDAFSTGSSIEKNIFLGWDGALSFDASSSGYTRNNRFIRTKAHNGADTYLKIAGNAKDLSTGNTFLFYNFLTPHKDSTRFSGIPDLSMIGIDAESWNWNGSGTGAVIEADATVGDIRMMAINGGDNRHNAGDPAATGYFNIAAKNFTLLGDVSSAVHNPKTRLQASVETAVLLNVPAINSSGETLQQDSSSTNLIRAPEPSDLKSALPSKALVGLRNNLIGRSEIRHDKTWSQPIYEAIPNPTGPNWNVDLTKKPDSTTYIQGLIQTQNVAILPAGIYYISQPLKIKKGQGLIGAGMESTAIVAMNRNIDMIIGDDHLSNPYSLLSITISDLTLQGGANGIHHGEAGSGGGAQYNEMFLSHLTFRNMSNAGIFIDSIFGWDNNLIDHVNFVNNKIGVQQSVNPNMASGDAPGITFMDKNLFYQNQYLGNEIALSLIANRANNLDAWANCLFKDNSLGAVKTHNTLSAIIANSDFVNNGGSQVIENDGYMLSIVESRFVAGSNGHSMLYGGYTVEGSRFEQVGGSAQIISAASRSNTSFFNSSSIDMGVGNLVSGFLFNNYFALNAALSKEGLVINDSAISSILPNVVPSVPQGQMLIGTTLDVNY